MGGRGTYMNISRYGAQVKKKKNTKDESGWESQILLIFSNLKPSLEQSDSCDIWGVFLCTTFRLKAKIAKSLVFQKHEETLHQNKEGFHFLCPPKEVFYLLKERENSIFHAEELEAPTPTERTGAVPGDRGVTVAGDSGRASVPSLSPFISNS